MRLQVRDERGLRYRLAVPDNLRLECGGCVTDGEQLRDAARAGQGRGDGEEAIPCAHRIDDLRRVRLAAADAIGVAIAHRAVAPQRDDDLRCVSLEGEQAI